MKTAIKTIKEVQRNGHERRKETVCHCERSAAVSTVREQIAAVGLSASFAMTEGAFGQAMTKGAFSVAKKDKTKTAKSMIGLKT